MGSDLQSLKARPMDWPAEERNRGWEHLAKGIFLLGFLGVLAVEGWLLLQVVLELP